MRLTSSAIQRLLSASERTLVASASGQALKDLTAARLRAAIGRTRRLRDKYKSLARTRGRTARGKAAPRGGAPRTDAATMKAKVAVFEELLGRFTTQLDAVERRAARAETPAARRAKARKTVARVKRRIAKQEGQPAPAPGAVAKTNTRRRAVSRAAKAAHVERSLAASHVTRAHAHIGSRTRRRQGRRDSR